ncbi:MAG: bifunctional 3-(3-hydroxy-phenyl)propionate/3-hydroxycinnamic acid hydroxylase [Gammaproteobacteria bacterium]
MIPQLAFDVVVVGMGPVGTLAANLLGIRGIKTLIIDKDADIYPSPRAIAFDHDAMRILQGCGLAEVIEPFIAPYAPSEYHGVDGRVISRFDMQAPPYPLGWAPNYVFRQPPFEAALREGLRRFNCVEVRTPCEFLSFEQKDHYVRISLDDGLYTEPITAGYLLGVDGGASMVRRLLGGGMASLDFDEPWLVVDALISDEALEKLPSTIIQYCDPSRPATYVIGTGNHRRWEIRLSPSESTEALQDERAVWDLLSPWLQPDEGVLWRWATYDFHAVVANVWRSGRVLLSGDAAHMTPPFMAQGMTQGVRDVANLVWKLVRVLEGRAGDSLLDTYMQERAPHVRATTEVAKGLGRVICETNPVAASERDAKMIAEFGNPPAVRSRQAMIPNLSAGLILENSAAAGSVFPQPFVVYDDERRRFDDIIGREPFLVIRSEADAIEMTPATTALCDEYQVQIVVLNVDTDTQVTCTISVTEEHTLLGDWFAEHHCIAVFVRPDFYVFGSAATSADIEKLCQMWIKSPACFPIAENGGAGDRLSK